MREPAGAAALGFPVISEFRLGARCAVSCSRVARTWNPHAVSNVTGQSGSPKQELPPVLSASEPSRDHSDNFEQAMHEYYEFTDL
jgi:hypothetical protein